MATSVTILRQELVKRVWACLQVPVNRNGLFTQLLMEQRLVSDICEEASWSFCPGLLEAMQASAPPPSAFFWSLPSDGMRKWGIYAVVRRKSGKTPLVYIGSATNTALGVHSRWLQYHRRSLNWVPFFVRRAMKQGYRITHKGLIVSSPIPASKDVPLRRLIFLAIEAAFSFLFWAMVSQDRTYGMRSCCPWPKELFSYHGLCSHNALAEKVHGNFDLPLNSLMLSLLPSRRRSASNTCLITTGFARLWILKVSKHKHGSNMLPTLKSPETLHELKASGIGRRPKKPKHTIVKLAKGLAPSPRDWNCT